ncbi:hypothetical protein CHS0354_037156 [Potamilus streckersoni]|uniref:Uncharacterized protein n=1 Tax=Potamilus streckersoni TaxID=2493646 RepID=A0AAE0W483_9BIVA|nr:hypothetical protein CHS0354_037156 [Potamilus streckersoni]
MARPRYQLPLTGLQRFDINQKLQLQLERTLLTTIGGIILVQKEPLHLGGSILQLVSSRTRRPIDKPYTKFTIDIQVIDSEEYDSVNRIQGRLI